MRSIVISKKELEKIYEENTARNGARIIGVCVQTYYKMLDEAGIPRKRPDFVRGESIKYIITE